MRIILPYLLLFFTFQGLAQKVDQAEKYYQLGNEYFDKFTSEDDSIALEYLRKATQLSVRANQKGLIYYQAYFVMGVIEMARYNYPEALLKFHHALTVKNDTLNDSVFVFRIYKTLAETEWYLDKYDSAIYYYSKAQPYISENIEDIYLAKYYNGYGNLLNNIGDYHAALAYFRKAEQLSNDLNSLNTLRLKNNIAHTLLKLNQFNPAIKIFTQLINKTESLKNKDWELYISLITNVSYSYLNVHKYDSALQYLHKANSFTFSENQRYLSRFYRMYAKAYQGIGNVQLAETYFEKAIAINQKYLDYPNQILPICYLELGKLFWDSDPRKALDYFERAAFFQDQSVTNGRRNLSPLTVEVLQAKGKGFNKIYVETQEVAELEQAMDVYLQAVEVADTVRKRLTFEKTKFFYSENQYPVYQEALYTANLLFEHSGKQEDLIRALQVSEKSKAAVLEEVVESSKVKYFTDIPQELIEKERYVKYQIASLTNRLEAATTKEAYNAIEKKLRAKEVALNEVISGFEKYPQYYNLKYYRKDLDVAEIQALAKEHNTALLEYFISEDQLYIFLVKENVLKLCTQVITPEFHQATQLIKKVLQTDRYQDSEKAFQKAIETVYRYVYQPCAAYLEGETRLTIVPDGDLNYIPFEILTEDHRQETFLLRKYAISYAYSLKLWMESLKQQKKNNSQVLAFAPFAGEHESTFRDDGFMPLKSSAQEVAEIGSMFLTGEAATKQEFVNQANRYGVIHLATHAQASDKSPEKSFIAFYPQDTSYHYKLYTHELYNLNLAQVDLVVLSACETGTGLLKKGEGVISLARAFMYAGCPNVVMTLWKADDVASFEISVNFYKHLKEGLPKDIALQQAKIDYLESDRYAMYKTPNYWANFILIGNPHPVFHSVSVAPYYVLLVLTGVMGMLIWVRKRVKSTRK
ncbi:CHAT domain-containing tetratricopeptide repeat protein [Rapidithrix thailandica]|uniref:CHAT domain-containing tetratricopeptide repeat protein n=1 Tax=Rapidithrix thailandica TaxID=413964 RepID=A0AAW9S4G8_9BACT